MTNCPNGATDLEKYETPPEPPFVVMTFDACELTNKSPAEETYKTALPDGVVPLITGNDNVLLLRVWVPANVTFEPSAVKIETPVEVKYKMPLSYWFNAKEFDDDTVAVPGVTVQTPTPMFRILRVSPAVNNAVLTVIVVAPALFMVIVVPASAATRVYEAVFALTV